MSIIEEQYRNYSVAAILWNVYIISTTGLFLAQRRNDVIRKRSISCCMLQVICGIATSNSWLARVNFWPVITTHYPWIMIMIINYTFNLNWMLSYFLRTIILLNDYYTNRIGSILQRKSDIENVDELLRQLQPSRAELIIFNIQKRFFNEDSQIDSEKEYLKYDRGRILENRIGIKRNIGLRQVLKCTAVVTAVEVVLFLIVMGYSGGFSPNAIDPFFSAGGKEWMPIYAFVVLYLIAAAYFLYLLRNVSSKVFNT
ncbi:hypothetical protein BKA69DRAFT_1056239 [Paraphysoderma sedebokerense]|nr:hypothetical protein BKA69DRAFT_1056239 [Paraphysoderma sedebokerense]